MVLMKRLASLGPLWRQQLIKRAQLSTAGAVGSSTTGKDNFDWLCSNKVSALEGKMQLGICRERMGHLAESSILGRAGGSVVHVALASKEPDETPKEDFLPLTVDYRARAYGFGIIPDVVRRREKHGDDDQVLVARFIDRAIRPLFPSGYVNEVQLTVTPHAVDPHHDPTVLALNAASLALMNSKHPWNGPIGCVRVGMVNNQLTVNPSFEQMQDSPLDLLYAGTKDRTVM